MVAVENTPQTPQHGRLHALLLLSLDVLGLPPVWYKSAPYRSRTVNDPRGVLAEFGVDAARRHEIRVWDSTAEMRYLVVPMRPAGTEGWSEEQLAALVTRDSHDRHRLPKAPARPRMNGPTIWAACTASARSCPSPTSRCSTRRGRGRVLGLHAGDGRDGPMEHRRRSRSREKTCRRSLTRRSYYKRWFLGSRTFVSRMVSSAGTRSPTVDLCGPASGCAES